MAVNSIVRTAGPFVGTGALITYPFTFAITASSDVLIEQIDTSGNITYPLLTTNFTVSVNGDQSSAPGGVVTPVVALPAGYTWTFTSNLQATQGEDITNAGGFLPSVINGALDRLTIVFQQCLNVLGRALVFPLAESGLNVILPVADLRANKALVFDADGAVTISTDNFNNYSSAVASAIAAAATATADVVLAHADVVLTHADVVLAHADVVLTHADVTSCTNSASIAANVAGYAYLFSSSTSSSDPGNGVFRFNNVTIASATQIYISETTNIAQGIAADIATWDDGTSTIKGKLRVVKQSNPSVFAVFNVTGSNSDGGAWDTVTIAYVTGAGAFSNNDAVVIAFIPKGDKGDAGAPGAGTGDMLAANNLSDLANKATARTNLGVVIGTDVQAYSSNLAALALLTVGVGASKLVQFTAATKYPAADGSLITNLPTPNIAASNITSGVIAMARLATGTPDGTKFIRDDGVLAVPTLAPDVSDGAVGAYGVFSISGSHAYGSGYTIAGASLSPAQSGTWKSCGAIVAAGGGLYNTLLQRIS